MLEDKMVTDNQILADLEYRGIQDFLTEMESGFFVPLCFVERVKTIIKREYGITLVESGNKKEVHKGCFCLMDYKDNTIELKTKE
jgi:hypothetical protein